MTLEFEMAFQPKIYQTQGHLYQERLSRRTSLMAFSKSCFLNFNFLANFRLSAIRTLNVSILGSSKGFKRRFKPSVITINFEPVVRLRIFRIRSGITTCPFEERLVTSVLIIFPSTVSFSYLTLYHFFLFLPSFFYLGSHYDLAFVFWSHYASVLIVNTFFLPFTASIHFMAFILLLQTLR